jgi:DNA-binding IclR family transcriptional regulator
MSLNVALEILKLLASDLPSGLTVPEIILRLRRPAAEVTRAIAVMQSRQWLRTNLQGGFSVCQRMLELPEIS